MKDVKWNLATIGSVDEFHDLVQDSLAFPHYYGRNADAFWDCLNEIVENTTVHVAGIKGLSPDLESKFDAYFAMCREYEEKTGGTFRMIIE
jgi:RNAse (barnase) inhibitor barstar